MNLLLKTGFILSLAMTLAVALIPTLLGIYGVLCYGMNWR